METIAKEKDFKQIFRMDGKDCFVELMSNGFSIDKAILRFREYDVSREKGDRYKKEIDIYIKTSVFLELCNDILSGRIAKLAETERAKKKQYCDSIFVVMGGTSAKRLKEQGKERADGLSIARQFKIIPGNKAPFVLVGESGAGEEDEKGLIVPRYGTKPEQKVQVPVTIGDVKQLALMFQVHYQAYLSNEYRQKSSEV